jgi:hypothetical protein
MGAEITAQGRGVSNVRTKMIELFPSQRTRRTVMPPTLANGKIRYVEIPAIDIGGHGAVSRSRRERPRSLSATRMIHPWNHRANLNS